MNNETEIEDVEERLLEAQEKRDEASRLMAELQREIKSLRGNLDLPTQPGWYLNSEDDICRLDSSGNWDDGWGNGGYAYGHHEYKVPLRRLLPAE